MGRVVHTRLQSSPRQSITHSSACRPSLCSNNSKTMSQNARHRNVVHCTQTQMLQPPAGLSGSSTMLCSQVLLHSPECVLIIRRPTRRCSIPKKSGRGALILVHIAIGCCDSIQQQRALRKTGPCKWLTGTQPRSLVQPPQYSKHLWCVACTAEGCTSWGTCPWAGQVRGTVLQETTLQGTGVCTADRPTASMRGTCRL